MTHILVLVLEAIFAAAIAISFCVPVLYIWMIVIGRKAVRPWVYLLVGYLIFSIHLDFVSILIIGFRYFHGYAGNISAFGIQIERLLYALPDHIAIINIFLPLVEFGKGWSITLLHLAASGLKAMAVFPLVLCAQGMPGCLEQNRAEPAYTHFIFLTAFLDLRGLYRRMLGVVARGQAGVAASLRFCFQGKAALVTWPFGLMLIVVLFIPVVAASFVIAGTIGVYAVAVAYTAGALLMVSFILRTAETAYVWYRWRYVKCPSCYEAVPRPTFLCPRCSAEHKDLVPGRFGLVQRRCECGEGWLPTLLVLGKARQLTSLCPSCHHVLAPGLFARNLHLFLIGGPASGKTSLITSALVELVEGRAAPLAVRFVDPKDAANYKNTWKPGFMAGLEPSKTLEMTPQAITVSAGIGRSGACTVYVYDPAGEVLNTERSYREQGYVRHAGGAILLIDPFSLELVREEQEDELAAQGVSYCRSDPHDIVDTLVSVLAAKGVLQRNRVTELPVAVVLPKVDAGGLDERMGLSLHTDGGNRGDGWSDAGAETSDEIRRWLDEVNSGVVQEIERQFVKVRYFAVSAYGPDLQHGRPFRPWGVLKPLLWLFSHESGAFVHESRHLTLAAQIAVFLLIVSLFMVGPVLGGSRLVGLLMGRP